MTDDLDAFFAARGADELPAAPRRRPRSRAGFDVDAWLAERAVDPSALSWDDYIGAEPAKREVRSLLARLAHRDELAAVGMAIPRGILIHGEPGVGKTYLARVMASELLRAVRDVDFFEVNAAELDSVERFESLLGALRARERMAIIALDEADVIGLSRWGQRQNPDARAILLAFLSALDGLRALDGVFWVLTANSSLEEFDSALVRPGRIDLALPLRRPTPAERLELFRYYAARVPTDQQADLTAAAELLGGATPAKVRGVMADAYALSLARGAAALGDADLREAIRRDGVVGADEAGAAKLHAFAVHEAGHAIIATILGVRPSLVVAHGHAGGRNEYEEGEEEDGEGRIAANSYAGLRASAVMCLAGIEAERLILGQAGMTTGNEQDITDASAAARRIVSNGMVAHLVVPSASVFGYRGEGVPYRASKKILAELLVEAESLVATHETAIASFAAVLEAERYLAGAALTAALDAALAEA